MLMRRWERARPGDGQLLLIVGEPGTRQVTVDRGVSCPTARCTAHLGRVELLAALAEHAAAPRDRKGSPALRRCRGARGATACGPGEHSQADQARSGGECPLEVHRIAQSEDEALHTCLSRPRAPRGFPRATRRPSRHAQRAAASPKRNSRWRSHPIRGTSQQLCPRSRSNFTLRRFGYRFTNPPEVTFTVPALTIVIGPDTVCGDAGTAAPGSGAGHGKNRRYSGSCHRRLLQSSTERI